MKETVFSKGFEPVIGGDGRAHYICKDDKRGASSQRVKVDKVGDYVLIKNNKYYLKDFYRNKYYSRDRKRIIR